MVYCDGRDESNLDSDLLVDTLLLLLDLLLKLLDRCSIRRGTVGLEDLDIPSDGLATQSHCCRRESDSYSSVRGVIFFSSISSSAKFFWYFSQFEPVAEGWSGQTVNMVHHSFHEYTSTNHDEIRKSPNCLIKWYNLELGVFLECRC